MPKRVEILKKEQVFKKAIFRIEEARLQHERFDGSMSSPIVRLNLDRGDAVAAVIHDPAHDTLVMIEQFRYPTVAKGPGWLLELPAGVVEDEEDPANTMRRELIEEIGYQVTDLQHISTFYTSPGGSSERVFLYYAAVSGSAKVAEGGGLDEEDEDIRSVILSVDEALQKMKTGEIADAKSIIGLQWLELKRSQTS